MDEAPITLAICFASLVFVLLGLSHLILDGHLTGDNE